MAGVVGVEPWSFTAWQLKTMVRGARPETQSTRKTGKVREDIPISASNISELKRLVPVARNNSQGGSVNP